MCKESHKFCTAFNGQLFRSNYAAMNIQLLKGGTVFGFPKDLDEQKRWEMSLSIKLRWTLREKEGRINRNIDVCYKHFLSNCLTKVLPGETKMLTKPPSVFSSISPSLISQTIWNISCEPEKQNVTSEAGAELAALKSVAEDTINTLDGVVWYCYVVFLIITLKTVLIIQLSEQSRFWNSANSSWHGVLITDTWFY